jgi:hypothetical protein
VAPTGIGIARLCRHGVGTFPPRTGKRGPDLDQ